MAVPMNEGNPSRTDSALCNVCNLCPIGSGPWPRKLAVASGILWPKMPVHLAQATYRRAHAVTVSSLGGGCRAWWDGGDRANDGEKPAVSIS